MAKRGRNDYLKLALHNLNQADNIHNYDVAVYIGEDLKENVDQIDYSAYSNLTIHHLYVPNLIQANGLFCKGHIMNSILCQMRQNYDFMSIIDIDIVYKKSFLDEMSNTLSSSNDENICLHTSGFYTQECPDYQKILKNNCDYEEILNNYPYIKHPGVSQISFTKVYHESIKQKLKINSIYDTGSLGYHFMGWGREDTLIQKIMKLYKTNIIILEDAWVHVWHAPQELKQEALLYNSSIMALLYDEVKERLRRNS